MEYQYPFSLDWTTDEIVDVVQFYQTIEKAYETGIEKTKLMNCYRRFKEIVPSKAEEKKFDKEFEEVSGYSSYKTIKKAKETESDKIIKMGTL
ncbi:UPF0223 family protein [Lederbergia wuyishanensis]|uniref:UPF0223 protein J2S14_000287 n=1 Tax=Lederbergia wuyishanensis TaxID=1347903 RepID=A0ABU0CZD4_9BACI|nr:UPF0223 family protein [Lederbergia wuyishanensis]MCJ8006125.1 UPF0223 family protein [Lederbergia wuyishanensis]MDQ0341494.1 uncharacterized protein YktA (UPF0223 family) [Lederbergia wuyishanensis]